MSVATSSASVLFEIARTAIRGLTLDEQRQLRDELDIHLAQEHADNSQIHVRSLRGLLADLGPAPSAEDIDTVRQEWSSFGETDR